MHAVVGSTVVGPCWTACVTRWWGQHDVMMHYQSRFAPPTILSFACWLANNPVKLLCIIARLLAAMEF